MNPREQLKAHGAPSLSDAELLAVLLGSGTKAVPLAKLVAEVAGQYPQFAGMATAQVSDLMTIPGLGLAKAAGLSAAVELGQRVWQTQALRHGSYVHRAALVKHLIHRLGGLGQEVILAVFIDTAGGVIQELEVSRGGMDRAIIDPRVVFRAGLLANAASVVLVHNHPSGNVQPSAADVDITERFIQAGDIMGMNLVDHFIVATKGYYAFSDHPEKLGLNF